MTLSCEPLCDKWNYLTLFVTCLYMNKAVLSAYNRSYNREECDMFKDAAVSQNLSAYSHNRCISMSGQHKVCALKKKQQHFCLFMDRWYCILHM